MNILLTNNTLADRAGSELYLRDVALALLARGHHPVAFSTTLGPVADELRRATVPVVDDLEQLGDRPDVIHGQHHLETAMAALRFPDVPVLNYCHGWLPWQEAPVKLPNVRQYVAVDATCRDRLRYTFGIPTERIEVLLNFVDLRRFPAGPELPRQPRRALVFGNGPNEAMLEPIRAACRTHGIALDVVGASFGISHAAPETLLANYDLVFAKARAALESMAVGRAVILFDAVGSGPLVTSAGFDRLRQLNFGIRSLRELPTTQHFVDEIAKYDADDAARVRDRVREEASLDAVVDRLVALYERLSAETIAPTVQAVGSSASAYIRMIAERVKLAEDSERVAGSARDAAAASAQTNAKLVASVSDLEARLHAATEALAAAQSALKDANARHTAAIARATASEARLTAVRDENAAMKRQIQGFERTLVEIHDSPAMRLRRGVIHAPVLGPVARRIGQRVLRPS